MSFPVKRWVLPNHAFSVLKLILKIGEVPSKELKWDYIMWPGHGRNVYFMMETVDPQPSALCRLLDDNIKGRVRSKYLPPFTLLPDSVSVGLDNNIESRESREVKVTSAGVWSVPLEVENKRTPHH